MNIRLLAVVAALVWGGVFALQLVAMWVVADIERRWNESWALEWERTHGKPIDELIEQLAGQIQGWRLARRLLNLYLVLAFVVIIALGVVQWQAWFMSGKDFAEFMRFLLAITGLLFMPLWAASAIGVGLAESMYRQVRVATGERIEITSAEEIEKYPKPERPKKEAPPAAPAPAKAAAPKPK
ncbi:MAG: hypothetical protein AAB152_03075 [Candidatus Coatesbacteria bacterium]